MALVHCRIDCNACLLLTFDDVLFTCLQAIAPLLRYATLASRKDRLESLGGSGHTPY